VGSAYCLRRTQLSQERARQKRAPDKRTGYPAPVTEDHDAEYERHRCRVEAAGILTVTTEADRTVSYALTREGKAIGRQLAMTQGEDARLAMLSELLDGPRE
jgi:hypothetical protein